MIEKRYNAFIQIGLTIAQNAIFNSFLSIDLNYILLFFYFICLSRFKKVIQVLSLKVFGPQWSSFKHENNWKAIGNNWSTAGKQFETNVCLTVRKICIYCNMFT
jgi:hypothetical protein